MRVHAYPYDSFTFASDPDQHICEVQLVHAGMLTARKHCNAHNAYAKFRSALEMLDTFGLGPGAAEDKEALGAAGMDHREFVQMLEDDYEDFLVRYQQTVGTGPVTCADANSSRDDVTPDVVTRASAIVRSQSPRADTRSLEELHRELKRLQRGRRQDKEEHQRQLDLANKKLELAGKKQQELERQLDFMDKKFQRQIEMLLERKDTQDQ